MENISRITKILVSLFDHGGELGRTELLEGVFRCNLSAARIDSLLASPELRELVSMSRGPLRGQGRTVTRYRLTHAGWSLLSTGLRSGVKPHRIDSDECRRQFDFLVADRDPWASELARQAARGREYEAAEQRKAEEARAARKAAASAQKPRVKRHRTAKDLESRKRWFEATMRAQGKALTVDGKWRPIDKVEAEAPRIAPATVVPIQAPADDWRPYIAPPPRPSPVPSAAMTPPIDPKTAALAERIRQAGFQVKDGKVLYGNAWVSVAEWRQKMGHIQL